MNLLADLEIARLVLTIAKFVAVAVLVWLLFRWKGKAFERAMRKDGADLGKLDILNKLGAAAIFLVGLMMSLEALGTSFATLWAVGGLGGISLAFAAQDVLGNFFGGLMIYLTRPFTIGDWIKLPEKNIEGHVEEIGWYMTLIRNFEKRPLYIPNATFSKIIVMTPSRMSHRQLELTLNLRHEDLDKVAAITADIKAYLRSHPCIDTSQKLSMYFQNLTPLAAELFLNAYTLATDGDAYNDLRQDILLNISRIVQSHKAAFATYPYPL